MKNKNVCKGCKYLLDRQDLGLLKGACDYCASTGQSRVALEMQNGGIKKDSCICYDSGEKRRKGALERI